VNEYQKHADQPPATDIKSDGDIWIESRENSNSYSYGQVPKKQKPEFLHVFLLKSAIEAGSFYAEY